MLPTANQSLRAAVEYQLAHPRLRPVLRQHCPYLPSEVRAEALSTEIHQDCQMLEFSLRHQQNAALSVSQYFAVALQQYQTMRQISLRVFGPRQDLRVLDFACGYGRLLRFLIHSLKPQQIWAADIQVDAVNYVREQFGVHALASTSAPEDFKPEQHFDMIWVASLFSHLPEALFQRWLKRLVGLLAPGGILCFSTHGEQMLPAGLELPESGFLYRTVSENESLGTDIYGTTHVSKVYVERSLKEVFGPDLRWRHFSKLLAAEQDVYIATFGPGGPDLAGLEDFRRGPRGWLDVQRHLPEGLCLQGWAAAIDDGDLDYLEIEFAGECRRLLPNESRPDVANVFGDPRLARSGFSCTLPWPEGDESA
ncbi:MAG: class I SAM-dependent methyltransferase, partial [Wenzhouxiangellaceae bacterium]